MKRVSGNYPCTNRKLFEDEGFKYPIDCGECENCRIEKEIIKEQMKAWEKNNENQTVRDPEAR